MKNRKRIKALDRAASLLGAIARPPSSRGGHIGPVGPDEAAIAKDAADRAKRLVGR